MKIKDLIKYGKKSKIRASQGMSEGNNKFYTSSATCNKFLNETQFTQPGIIMGTGGNVTLHYSEGNFSVSTDCVVLFPNKLLITKYLYYFFKANIHVLKVGFKGAGLKHTSKKYINSIDVNHIPPHSIQIEVVSVLEKLENIVKLKENQIIEFNQLIKSRFVEMFSMPHEEKYETKTLLEFTSSEKTSLKRGPFGGSLKKDDFVADGYLVYEQRHAIHNDFEYEKYYITEEKYNNMIGFKVVPGDLLVSCSGVTLGRIAEVPEGAKKGIINQALLKITLDNNLMSTRYFIELFRNNEIQDILFGFSRGSGIPNFPSMREVKKVEFLCPPIELQNQFSEFVQQVDKLKFKVQKSLDETQKLFDSLMQEYFG